MATDSVNGFRIDRGFQVYRQIYATCGDLNHAVHALATELHDLREAKD